MGLENGAYQEVMRITVPDRNCIIVHALNGDFHITEEQGVTRIMMYDHFNLTVIGKHKECPSVVIDSDEFPTRLEIKETEHKWFSALCAFDSLLKWAERVASR